MGGVVRLKITIVTVGGMITWGCGKAQHNHIVTVIGKSRNQTHSSIDYFPSVFYRLTGQSW